MDITKAKNKSKKFTYVILISMIMAFFAVSYLSVKNVFNNERKYQLELAEIKILNIEKAVNYYLRIIDNNMHRINQQNYFEDVHHGARSVCDTNVEILQLLRRDEVHSISMVNVLNDTNVRYESHTDNDDIVIYYDRPLPENFISNQNSSLLRGATVFTPIYLKERYPFRPVSAAYLTIVKKDKIVGVIIAEFYIEQMLSTISTSDLFNVSFYDENAKIFYTSKDNVIRLGEDSFSLLDNNFDYKKMLTPDIYNNGDTISKILSLDYFVKSDIGIHLEFNEKFKGNLEFSFNRFYHIYLLIFSLVMLFLFLIIRKYIADTVKFNSMEKYTRWLEIKNVQLTENTMIDSLTGLGNKSFYDRKITEMVDTYHRYENIFSVFVFRINEIDMITKKYDKTISNDVIKAMTDNLKIFIRKSDTFIRYSNNRFLILLPNTDAKFAEVFKKKISEYVANMECNAAEISFRVTIECGYTAIRDDDDSPSLIFKRAVKSMKHSSFYRKRYL